MTPKQLCELFGIKYPILQGGMAWISRAELVAAVSNAGGLGMIGSGSMPPEILRSEIIKTKELTKRPFGVNIILLNPEADKLLDVILEEKVPVVSLGAGDPSAKTTYLKSENPAIKVIAIVASSAHAKRAEKYGADAVVAEGTEAGGHIGELASTVVIPQVKDAVSIPVIAAGGFVDGRGFVAALVLGASGVQMGTRFIASEECTAHSAYKEMIVRAKDRDTVVTGRSVGLPCRVIKNDFTREYQEREKSILLLEGEEFQVARLSLEEFAIGRLRMAAETGDMNQGSIMAGQSSALIKDIKPVAKIIKDIIREAEELIDTLPGLKEQLYC